MTIPVLFGKLHDLPLMGWMLRRRFVKFGTVGASGVFVNMGFLYLAQEHLFTFVASPGMRLNASMAVAIFFATVNNFAWNRLWTWADRKHHHDKPLALQFGQYALACWVGIALQVVITKLLVAAGAHYLTANLAAILFASVFNFAVNDFWTFSRLKLLKIPAGTASDPPGKGPRDNATR